MINFIAMLLFDSYSEHNTNVSPAPWEGKYFSNDKQVELGNKSECDLFIENQRILIQFCMNQREDIVWKFFGNRKAGQIGWAPGKLDAIWTSSVRFVKQFNDGGVSTSHNSGEKRNECMWIHHFVILQLFHSKFRHCGDVNFLQDNHLMFVRGFNSDDQKTMRASLVNSLVSIICGWVTLGRR
jgi:hypothetical protein